MNSFVLPVRELELELDENILVPVPRMELVLWSRDRSMQTIDTTTANRKIAPKIQKESASFDCDKHRIPSPFKSARLLAGVGYSSTEIETKRKLSQCTQSCPLNYRLCHSTSSPFAVVPTRFVEPTRPKS
jgi:hypothetical protein